MDKFAMFILGVGAGIAWYRATIVSILRRHPHTICDYCEFKRSKEIDYPPKCPPPKNDYSIKSGKRKSKNKVNGKRGKK